MAALEAVWDDLNAQDVDSVYCLGDLVGYGPFPNEVIKFVQDKHIPQSLDAGMREWNGARRLRMQIHY